MNNNGFLCDGICRKKSKKCGHLKELIVQVDSKPQTIEKCVFEAMMDSLLRQEQSNIRIQAAIEHSRNQKNTDDLEIKKMVGHGFIGLIHTFQQNPEAVKQAGISKAALMKMVEMTEKKQEAIAGEQVKIAKGDK